jgi:choline kinase
MKGLVLAAGAGRRLRPHTDDLPKALLTVADELTILDLTLRNFASVEITEVVLVVGHRADAVFGRREALERAHGVRLSFVHNDRAADWNNCYSLWLARDHLREDVLLINGDTVHPPSVERTLLARRGRGGIVLAVDDAKPLAEEEMKLTIDAAGGVTQISKLLAPALADAEYIGATLVEAPAGDALGGALERTWQRDPHLFYEDGFQTFIDSGGSITTAPIGAVEWVEVDSHDDLAKAREIACRY